jgi:NifU homolog involved in Fe-S cluster formation
VLFVLLVKEFYPKKIGERFRAPRNAGRAFAPNGVGTEGAFVCGTAVRFTLRIDKTEKRILEARFQTNGCGFMTAAADLLAEKVEGRNLSDLHGLETSYLQSEIERELGKFPSDRKHCLNASIEALHAAFADFRAAQLEEFSGEKALVCTCFGVSEETVERVIEENAFDSVEQVSKACKAGAGCGSCRVLIQEIIDSRAFFLKNF